MKNLVWLILRLTGGMLWAAIVLIAIVVGTAHGAVMGAYFACRTLTVKLLIPLLRR